MPMENLSSSEGYIGTSPCQDFSVLYKGEGLAGPRGSLFMIQLYQIKELVARSSSPLRWCLLGNVGGVLARRKGHTMTPFEKIAE